MKIEITLTKESYREDEKVLTVSNEKLNRGWLLFNLDGNDYSCSIGEVHDFAKMLLNFRDADIGIA